MSEKIFLDSNLLVYAYDDHEPERRDRARAILSKTIADHTAVVSAQILSEFFVVVTRRIAVPMSPDEAEKIVEILSVLPCVDIDLPLVKRAIETHIRYRISYWDALVVAAAERVNCAMIYSEDLNDGQSYYDSVVVNPFK